jgi:hypothetical protein
MSTERQPRPVDRLTLEALPDAVPAGRRLAGLLKVALRCFGLRCREAREVPPAAGGGGTGACTADHRKGDRAMIDELRASVRDCREALANLDAHLSGARTVPALAAAKLLVALAGFTAKLARLSAELAGPKPGQAPHGGPSLFDGPGRKRGKAAREE